MPSIANGALATTEVEAENHNTSKPQDEQDKVLTRVIDPKLITTDADGLKFSSASSLQILPLLAGHGAFASLSNFLVTSPYNSPEHHMDLTRLDLEYRVFTLALSVMRPVRPDYATAPYLESFNWNEVLDLTRRLAEHAGFTWTQRDFYAVIFRSTLKEDADRNLLSQLDSNSHAEAVVSGGLLKYWFGTCNSQCKNLATCIWRNAADAQAGGTGPWHAKARRAGASLYEEIRFSTWRMTIGDDANTIQMEEAGHRRLTGNAIAA